MVEMQSWGGFWRKFNHNEMKYTTPPHKVYEKCTIHPYGVVYLLCQILATAEQHNTSAINQADRQRRISSPGPRDPFRHARRRLHRRGAQHVSAGAGRGVLARASQRRCSTSRLGERREEGLGRGRGRGLAGSAGESRDKPARPACASRSAVGRPAPRASLLPTHRARRRDGRPCILLPIMGTSRR